MEFSDQQRDATKQTTYSPVEKQNDLELDFKVFFSFVDSCCVGIVLDESN